MSNKLIKKKKKIPTIRNDRKTTSFHNKLIFIVTNYSYRNSKVTIRHII